MLEGPDLIASKWLKLYPVPGNRVIDENKRTEKKTNHNGELSNSRNEARY
jgi:hypothetical protein